MQKFKSPVKVILAAAAAAVVLCTCGLKTIGSGLIVWATDEDVIATGELVPILQQSDIEGTYTIAVGEEETLDLPMWRVKFFDNSKEAEQYKNSHAEFLRLVAIAKIDSLAVRVEPDPLAQRVYKLREYEVMKIIDRSAEKEKVGTYEDYWYQIVTKDGTEGWCYGESLIIQKIGEELNTNQGDGDIDPDLAAFLDNTWRPEYFQTSIDEGTINLEDIRPEIGLFPNPEDKTILYATKKGSIEYSYTDIISGGGNLYLFRGTPIKVRVYTPERIMFEHLENGKSVQKLYIVIHENIEEIVQQEQDRRWGLYNYLTEKGTIFTSNAYGVIEFINHTKFSWKDFQRLVPNVIPPNIQDPSGKLEFSLFLGDDLKSKYDGALVLTFIDNKDSPIALLFTRSEQGVQFVYAPPSTITGTVVEREPTAPVVMFFSIQGE